MARLLPITVGVLLIVACTALHGVWTQRWSSTVNEDLQALAATYDKIPKVFGDWESREDAPLTGKRREVSGAHATVSRTYRNRKTGETVSVFMICGLSRDVAVHTPDHCYVGAGFTIEEQPKTYRITTGESESLFKTATFLKETTGSKNHQRIFWSWKAEGKWVAPDNPRFTFGGRIPLNKIYLISKISNAEQGPAQASPVIKFADEFLPEVDRVLAQARVELETADPADVAHQ